VNANTSSVKARCKLLPAPVPGRIPAAGHQRMRSPDFGYFIGESRMKVTDFGLKE
jgi:hypothetical protein